MRILSARIFLSVLTENEKFSKGLHEVGGNTGFFLKKMAHAYFGARNFFSKSFGGKI